jgi:hypothetical protein
MQQREDGGVFLTPKDLYRLVWTKAMRRLGPELGISDVGLKKLCRQLGYPRLPWATGPSVGTARN